jgi:hypothetical protein
VTASWRPTTSCSAGAELPRVCPLDSVCGGLEGPGPDQGSATCIIAPDGKLVASFGYGRVGVVAADPDLGPPRPARPGRLGRPASPPPAAARTPRPGSDTPAGSPRPGPPRLASAPPRPGPAPASGSVCVPSAARCSLHEQGERTQGRQRWVWVRAEDRTPTSSTITLRPGRPDRQIPRARAAGEPWAGRLCAGCSCSEHDDRYGRSNTGWGLDRWASRPGRRSRERADPSQPGRRSRERADPAVAGATRPGAARGAQPS